MNNYGIDIWGDDNFFIDKDKIKLNYASKPAIIDIVKHLRQKDYMGPLLLRFPHLTNKQLEKLYTAYDNSIKEYDYNGCFSAVFPLKVNQMPNFVEPLMEFAKKYNYGLEAGSKAELLLAIVQNNKNAKITVNGFKDKEMILLAFIAKSMGFDITLIIEGLNELETIIDVHRSTKMNYPNVAIRVKLHSSDSGIWAKSGGIDSKFGLSSTEIIEAFYMMKKNNLLHTFTMIHFHIGSALTTISPFKKALKETGHIYAELKQMGATNLNSINIGGGLNIEYSQFESSVHYSLQEFSNDVIFTLQRIAKQKGVKEPNIITESGRFISASSTVLVTPVLELFSAEYELEQLKISEKSPQIIKELKSLYDDIQKDTAVEFMHDSLDHLESILTLFDLGYVKLQDRSNAEILTQLIIKKSISMLSLDDYSELKKIEEKIQEKYLLNFSIFQSLPDFWGLNQAFPISPLTHLDKNPTRSASLWDITCDSDGEIPFVGKYPLYLHDINLKNEEYFLGFFNVGAYQDTLGMKHNLFSKPTQVNVSFDENDNILYKNIIESENIMGILENIDYDTKKIKSKLDELSSQIDIQNKEEILKLFDKYLNDNGYLKTHKIQEKQR